MKIISNILIFGATAIVAVALVIATIIGIIKVEGVLNQNGTLALAAAIYPKINENQATNYPNRIYRDDGNLSEPCAYQKRGDGYVIAFLSGLTQSSPGPLADGQVITPTREEQTHAFEKIYKVLREQIFHPKNKKAIIAQAVEGDRQIKKELISKYGRAQKPE